MQIMAVVAFLIALAVIGLTLYTLTLAKLREHAIVKALGGRNRRLAGVGPAPGGPWSVALAVVLATAPAVALGQIVGTVSPATTIAVEPGSVLRVTLVALAVGAIGALVPLRRVAGVDPASAFRRTA
ncbi:MAG TPA: ABC transporter permease [Kineosporiaceae bacterium]